MEHERFERFVTRAIDGLPEEFRLRLENVDIVVAERPTRRQLPRLRERRGETLLGLYEGIPLTRRGRHYGLVTPDKITIFQKPIEAMCRNDAEIIATIQRVVQHEIAHHFGISDDRLHQLDAY
jgi:predicted Zn-dependent protease with MMP-like domain